MNLSGDFYKGKKILLTGHTGFKGTWMCRVLLEMGAEVCLTWSAQNAISGR